MRLHAIVTDIETARAAVEGGATVVQLRLKGAATEEVVEVGRPFREPAGALRRQRRRRGGDSRWTPTACTSAGTTLAPSGRSEPACSSASPRSSVEEAQAGQTAGAAYVGAGPVWATPSKPDADPPIGLEGLAAICRAVSIPVVAIGGIDASNARACLDAGAAGVAVVQGRLGCGGRE